MNRYVTAFQMTQSMFCSLPVPCKKWDEECRPYMLIFLPLIGLEIGLLWFGMEWLASFVQMPAALSACLMCGFPYLVTGFMHLDGFMDVTDAVCSWRDLERRREILKDSHVGSFAVVWCIFLILAGFAAFSSLEMTTVHPILILIPVLSRCLSALAIMTGKPMNTSQYAQINYPKWHQAAVILVGIVGIVFGMAALGITGACLLGEVIIYGIAWKKSTDSLQGMNGDISGYCICISELGAVIILAFL